MVASNNVVFLFDFAPFGLSLPPLPMSPSATCNPFPERRRDFNNLSQEAARSPDQHVPAIVHLKMFDIEVNGLR